MGFKTGKFQRRRRGIFIETGPKRFSNSVRSGIFRVFPEYAAPMGLEILLILVSTTMALLTELFCNARQIGARLRLQ
jgi:hypothetical protein